MTEPTQATPSPIVHAGNGSAEGKAAADENIGLTLPHKDARNRLLGWAAGIQPAVSRAIPRLGPNAGAHLRPLLLFIPILVAFWLVLVIIYRLARPESDILTFGASIAQVVSLLALLGIGLRQDRSETLAKASLWWIGGAWGVVFVLVSALLLLPGIVARANNIAGAAALADGRLSAALDGFRRAAGLDPSNAVARYNLGDAYEATGDFDQAMAEYRRALELDDGLAPAYNNLGRLYLRAHRDSDAALAALLAGLAATTDPLETAVLTKNIGWAYLEKGLTATALETLARCDEQLQTLSGRGLNVALYEAEVDRLTALAHEERQEMDLAQRSWRNCLGHALAVFESDTCKEPRGQAGLDCVSAQVWAAEAVERLQEGDGGG